MHRTALKRRDIKYAQRLAAAAYGGSDEQWQREREEAREHLAGEEATKASEPRFKFLDDDEILRLAPAAGIVGDILFEDSIAFLLYAREGRWKTFLALDWALCCASGRSWQGRIVKAGPAVYIAGEGARGIGKRVAAWKVHHQLRGERTQLKVLGAPVQLLDVSQVRDLIACIRAQVGQPVLVVIDTLARSMAGGDENAAKDVNTVTAAATDIQQAFGCCVLIVHHAGKDEMRGMRGSSALRTNPDSVIRISGNDAEPTIKPGDPITVSCEKTKDETTFADITLTAKLVYVVTEDGASTFSSLVLIPADAATLSQRVAPLRANQQKALDRLYAARTPLRAKVWLGATELADRSFYDARDALLGLGYVTHDELTKTYSVTTAGAEHVAAELRAHCGGRFSHCGGRFSHCEQHGWRW